MALWFLDRHLRRTKPEWLKTYRRCLALLPLLLAGMLWQLSRTASLADDNGLFWRITQHAGADLLPNVSSHMLVSTHVFLEMLHYGVWIVALPLIGATGAIWSVKSIPVASHSRGFPKLIAAFLICGLFVVAAAVVWLFSELHADARRLLCRRDGARAGRSAVFVANDLILRVRRVCTAACSVPSKIRSGFRTSQVSKAPSSRRTPKCLLPISGASFRSAICSRF